MQLKNILVKFAEAAGALNAAIDCNDEQPENILVNVVARGISSMPTDTKDRQFINIDPVVVASGKLRAGTDLRP